jgi:hypothetical protein
MRVEGVIALVVFAAGLKILSAADTAGASWRSSTLMGPNQGYCKDGRQHADVRDCAENRSGATRRPKNDQRQPAQSIEPDN